MTLVAAATAAWLIAQAFHSPAAAAEPAGPVTGIATANPVGLLARGKPSKHGKKKPRSASPSARDSTGARPNSSESNRQNKSAVFLVGIGNVDVFNWGYGVEAGYFANGNDLMELSIFQSSFDFLGLTSKVDFATVRYKHFFANSFYLHGGIGVSHTVSAVEPIVVFGDGSDYSSELTATQLVGELAIGNRWQFESFTLGCDWVGMLQPIATLAQSETFSDEFPAEDKNSRRGSFEDEISGRRAVLVRFQIGFAI